MAGASIGDAPGCGGRPLELRRGDGAPCNRSRGLALVLKRWSRYPDARVPTDSPVNLSTGKCKQSDTPREEEQHLAGARSGEGQPAPRHWITGLAIADGSRPARSQPAAAAASG